MMMLSASGTAVRLNPDPLVGASTAAQKRKAELWAYWDHTASTWAEIDEYLGKVTEPVSTELLRSGGVSGGKAVLDVGCGTGDLTVAAARAVGNGRVFALDISQAMLRLAQSKAQGVSNIEFLVEDIQSVTNLDGAIDVAICRFSLPLFDDPREALKRIAQSVKVGGRIAVAVWGPPASNGFLSAPIEALRTIGVQSPGPLSRAFALSDESVLNEALQSAGFRDCKGVAIQMSLQAPNSYRYWNFIRQYFSDIRTFSPAVQDSLRQEIARMIALPPTTALTFSAQALVYSATK
jgi:ubiquinone/menaquinone biosynthesis C-methylase UbiE